MFIGSTYITTGETTNL